jgi:hypothetical protein
MWQTKFHIHTEQRVTLYICLYYIFFMFLYSTREGSEMRDSKHSPNLIYSYFFVKGILLLFFPRRSTLRTFPRMCWPLSYFETVLWPPDMTWNILRHPQSKNHYLYGNSHLLHPVLSQYTLFHNFTTYFFKIRSTVILPFAPVSVCLRFINRNIYFPHAFSMSSPSCILLDSVS